MPECETFKVNGPLSTIVSQKEVGLYINGKLCFRMPHTTWRLLAKEVAEQLKGAK